MVKTYSLKASSWTRVKDCPYDLGFTRPIDYRQHSIRGYGVFANGAFHWRAMERRNANRSFFIVAFDFGVEEFQIIRQPDYWVNERELNVGV